MYLEDAAATGRAGAELARDLEAGSVVALVGDLGAGKTTFVRGVARGLGLTDLHEVVSPTYAILHDHDTPRGLLVHADFYRLDGPESALGLGLEDYFRRADVFVFVEWPERARDLLPERTRWLELSVEGEGRRLRWIDRGLHP